MMPHLKPQNINLSEVKVCRHPSSQACYIVGDLHSIQNNNERMMLANEQTRLLCFTTNSVAYLKMTVTIIYACRFEAEP